MKTPLSVLAIVAVILCAMWLFAPSPAPEMVQTRTDMPWQIKPLPDGNSLVFDLELGQATLADAMKKFQQKDGTKLAVFQPVDSPAKLEAYFGKVAFGPLNANIVVSLEASQKQLQDLIANAGKREGSTSGDWKYILTHEQLDQLLPRKVSGITFIPGTRNLDAGFLRTRFGEPAATLAENETGINWFYPQKGLSILIDEKAKEIFDYVAPKNFVMPDGASTGR